MEQPKTMVNLKEKCHSIHTEVNNNVEVRIDGNRVKGQDFEYMKNLSQIIENSGELGTFELGSLEISINSLESYEHNLIINKEKKDAKN